MARNTTPGEHPRSEPRWRTGVVDLLEVSPDLVFDLPRVTAIGSMYLCVENHRGLETFTPERIIIAVPGGRIVVDGQDLRVATLHAREITLAGRLRQITFPE